MGPIEDAKGHVDKGDSKPISAASPGELNNKGHSIAACGFYISLWKVAEQRRPRAHYAINRPSRDMFRNQLCASFGLRVGPVVMEAARKAAEAKGRTLASRIEVLMETCDAVMLTAHAVEQAGSTDRTKIRDET